MPAELAHLTFW